MTVRIGLVLAAALCGISAAAPHGVAAGQVPQVDARAVVNDVRTIIADRYILPERRPELDAVLAQGLASGRYDVRDPAVLGERINADLARVGRDKHLNFRFDPKEAAVRIADNASKAAPNAAAGPSAYERRKRTSNYGVTELRLLPGNIRYMAFDHCSWTPTDGAAAIDNAMRFLAGGDAVIIDLRRNNGGDAAACNYLTSYFLPPKQKLYTFYANAGASASVAFTPAELGAERLTGKPLYILISSTTASAAEAVAGSVAGYKVGELVGENTAGGGYSNQNLPVAERFMMSVSVARVELGATGRDWEGVGFAPTIPSAAQLALDVAQGHALRRLAAVASAQDRAGLEATAEWLSARAEPRSPALPPAAYAGSFGERKVKLEGGKLYYQFGERPRRLLIPLGGHLFTLENDHMLRIQFVVSRNSATALEVTSVGAASQGRYDRTK